MTKNRPEILPHKNTIGNNITNNIQFMLSMQSGQRSKAFRTEAEERNESRVAMLYFGSWGTKQRREASFKSWFVGSSLCLASCFTGTQISGSIFIVLWLRISFQSLCDDIKGHKYEKMQGKHLFPNKNSGLLAHKITSASNAFRLQCCE